MPDRGQTILGGHRCDGSSDAGAGSGKVLYRRLALGARNAAGWKIRCAATTFLRKNWLLTALPSTTMQPKSNLLEVIS